MVVMPAIACRNAVYCTQHLSVWSWDICSVNGFPTKHHLPLPMSQLIYREVYRKSYPGKWCLVGKPLTEQMSHDHPDKFWVPVYSIQACFDWHDNHAQQSTSTAVTVGCTIGKVLRKHSKVLLYSLSVLSN